MLFHRFETAIEDEVQTPFGLLDVLVAICMDHSDRGPGLADPNTAQGATPLLSG